MAITVTTALLESLAPAGTSEEALDAAMLAAEEDVNAAALVLWWDFRSDMVSSPLKWAAQGDYSQDMSKNVDEVNKQVAYFEQVVGVGQGASGIDPTLPTLGTAPMRRLGREGLFVGDPLVSAPPSTVVDLSNEQIWARLQAIADAVFQTTLNSYISVDVDLVADTPYPIDLTLTVPTIGEVVVVEVRDDLGMVVTSGIEVTIGPGDSLVTLEAGSTLPDYQVTILGHPI